MRIYCIFAEGVIETCGGTLITVRQYHTVGLDLYTNIVWTRLFALLDSLIVWIYIQYVNVVWNRLFAVEAHKKFVSY